MTQPPSWQHREIPSSAPPKWFKASGFGMHVTTFVPSEKRVDIRSGEHDTVIAVQWTEEITGEPLGWRVYCRRKDPNSGSFIQHTIVDLLTPELELAFGLKDEPAMQSGDGIGGLLRESSERSLFCETIADTCMLDAFRRGRFARLGKFLVIEDHFHETLIPVFVGDVLRDCVEGLIRPTREAA